MGQTGWGLERLGWGRAYAPGSAGKTEKEKPGKYNPSQQNSQKK
jgi:hypothetical protein